MVTALTSRLLYPVGEIFRCISSNIRPTSTAVAIPVIGPLVSTCAHDAVLPAAVVVFIGWRLDVWRAECLFVSTEVLERIPHRVCSMSLEIVLHYRHLLQAAHVWYYTWSWKFILWSTSWRNHLDYCMYWLCTHLNIGHSMGNCPIRIFPI